MIRIAVYGKGGIGKSTVTANLAAAFAMRGKKVLQIGCDPKADSTINLLGGEPLEPVMNFLRDHDREPEIDDIVRTGFGGVQCIETGGPTPGIGCAGRGIIATFNLIDDLRIFRKFQPDIVLYEEQLDENVLAKSVHYLRNADVLIVGGTSLNVYPAAGLINYYRGNKLVLVNLSETPYDSCADLIIHEKIGEVFSRI